MYPTAVSACIRRERLRRLVVRNRLLHLHLRRRHHASPCTSPRSGEERTRWRGRARDGWRRLSEAQNEREREKLFFLSARGRRCYWKQRGESPPASAHTHLSHTHTMPTLPAPMLEFLSSRCIHIGRSVATPSSCPHIDAYCTAWRNRMRYSHHSSIVSPSESLTTPPTPLPPTFEPSATTALPTASAVKLLRASLSSSPASASHAGLPRCGQPAHR